MEKKGKLELTWVGKNEEKMEEPRLLIENKKLSYGDKESENMLIHGDNLLALKALETDFSGKIKCVYIDPPFNTGARIDADGREIGYEDGYEHSIWLDMMHKRLELIKILLADNGAIFIHLDENEIDYCKVMMDEIFGRKNFMNRITVDSRSPSAFSTVNPGVFKSAEYILFYAKDRSKLVEYPIRVERTPDYAYDKFIINFEENYSKWKYITVSEAFDKNYSKKSRKPQGVMVDYNRFIVENADRIFRFTAISDTGAGKAIVELKHKSLDNKGVIFRMERDGELDDIYILNGQQISFYKKNIREIDGKKCATTMLTDIWTDIAWEGIANEGGVTFKKGKKPEKLLKRCLELVTNEGDMVLDSFLGSGTTVAVAHKMKRKWIGIEMGEHCYSHSRARINYVIDGDKTGISSIVDWQGGGGYKFYELAEPLLVKNKVLPVYQINPSYTWNMVCEAICKIEGFTYEPSGEFQGHSSENRFIHITEEFVNTKYVMSIMKNLGDKQSLLIYCKKNQADMMLPENVEVKKIPKDLLDKCNFESEVQE